MKYTRAENTVRTYEYGWRKFTRWCEAAGHASLPAAPETVLDYITCRIDLGSLRLSTIRTEIHSIQYRHVREDLESPVNHSVKLLFRTAARKLRERPRGKRALRPDTLRAICAALDSDRGAAARRDQALVLVGFTSGWRRSELAELAVEDLWFESDDSMQLQLGASKSDQSGAQGRRISIPRGQCAATCPIRAVRAWLEIRGDWRGPLFCAVDPAGAVQRRGISGVTINLRLKRLLAAAGENPVPYGAHSLRVGMITSSAENGADVASIMQRTGQRDVQTVMRYIRPVAPFKTDPLKGIL